MPDIRVFSEDEYVLCEKCSGRCDVGLSVSHDEDGPLYPATCLRCKAESTVQFEDEEEREITGGD